MTMSKERIHYARILVEVDINSMPEEVFFENELGILVEQKRTYEWKAT